MNEERLKKELEEERKARLAKKGIAAPAAIPPAQPLSDAEFRQRQVEKLAAEHRERKRLEHEEKERVKRLLEEDRLRRFGPQAVPMPLSSALSPAPSPAPEGSLAKSTHCQLQIRLPHGAPLKQKFASASTLGQVTPPPSRPHSLRSMIGSPLILNLDLTSLYAWLLSGRSSSRRTPPSPSLKLVQPLSPTNPFLTPPLRPGSLGGLNGISFPKSRSCHQV